MEEEYYENFMKKDGLIVERIPTYWNEKVVNETINVTLSYQTSNFKSRKNMYNKMLKDLAKVEKILKEAQQSAEREEK